MASLKGSKEIKNAVLHVLANEGEALSPAQIADILNVKQGLISRALFDARRDRPPVIQLSPSDKNRFEFISGNETALEPLPEDVAAMIPGKKASKPAAPAPAANIDQSSSSDSEDVENAVVSLFHDRKNLARSDFHEKLADQYQVGEIDAAIETLLSKNLFSQIKNDEFEEDILVLSKKGQSFLKSVKGTTPSSAAKAPKAAPAKKVAAKKAPTKKETKPLQKTAGRPTGERDVSELRNAMVEYIAGKEDVSKSDVSRNLSTQLKSFGRPTISEEFIKMIDEGILEQSQDKNGSARLGRYRMATKSAPVEAKADSSSATPPRQGAKSAAAKPASTAEEEDLDALKKDLAEALNANGEGLSKDVGGLFNRVVDYVRHLEETNQRLRSQMITMIENMR